ncbi:MAG: hypothetical protein QOH21_2070 [Acidobacteriota bacterium]|jgi:hypothetical protein|nr:hypothetical protein [Acidobacteriota bacterium]
MAEPAVDAVAEIEAELNAVTEQARRLIDSTDGRLFTVRPALGSWSASECIAHINLFSELFLPVLGPAINDARERKLVATKKPAKMDLLGRILRWFLEPPTRQRLKTSAPFVPKSIRAKSESFAEFVTLQNQLIDLARAARGIDLGRRIVSPFDKRLKFNLYSAFRIVAAHERRHLWQAEQAVAALRAKAQQAS